MKMKNEPVVEETTVEQIVPEEEAEILETPAEKADPLAEMTDRYARTLAEFDNYRKRTSKEMAARYDDGIRAAAERLLPIVDNFERALQSAPPEDPFADGIKMIDRGFGDVLTDLGLVEIDAIRGDTFDPNLHNAVAHTEDENLGENEISEVLQKGYRHRDRVIRPVMVRVAN